MAFFESLGGFAGGLAEGALAGQQLGLEQEASDIRQSRIDALSERTDLEREEFDLRRPLIEEDIAGIEDRKKMRIAALDEQQSRAEIAAAEAAKLEDFRTIGDFFVETLGEVATPSMVNKFEERFRLTHGSSINKADMINRKQYEDFFEDFREAPDFKETYTDIFTSGIAESEERKGVLNTELSNLLEKGPPDQKAFEKSQQLQAEIAEHEEAKNIFNRMIGRVNDISEQPAIPKRPRELDFAIRAAGLNPDAIDFNTMTEDEAVDVLKKVQEFGRGSAIEDFLDELIKASPNKPPGWLERIFSKVLSKID